VELSDQISMAFLVVLQRPTPSERVHELNGQPALVFYHENAPFAALLLAIANRRSTASSSMPTWIVCGISAREPRTRPRRERGDRRHGD
jgi:hypothetical protein